MIHSIQENLKRINSSITFFDCLSILATTFILFTFVIFLYLKKLDNTLPVIYLKTDGQRLNVKSVDSQPFASVNGKTYTFSWCQGAGSILEKNKIYFEDEESAKNSGRALSKLCQK